MGPAMSDHLWSQFRRDKADKVSESEISLKLTSGKDFRYWFTTESVRRRSSLRRVKSVHVSLVISNASIAVAYDLGRGAYNTRLGSFDDGVPEDTRCCESNYGGGGKHVGRG
jgi:hypothetical protein